MNVDRAPEKVQKLVYKLDVMDQQNLTQHHSWKLKKSRDKVQCGLLAQLKKDRLAIFKGYLTQSKTRVESVLPLPTRPY